MKSPASLLLLLGAAALLGGAALASISSVRASRIVLQPAKSAVVSHTGCLLLKDTRFIQQDEETQQIFEINGPDLRANVGNKVQITGRIASTRPVIQIATAVIDVTTVSPRSRGGCLSVASSLGAQAN